MPLPQRRAFDVRHQPTLDEELRLPAWPPDERAVQFIARLSHSKGEWAGQPFTLLPWQEERIIRPLFGTLRPDGVRQYRTVYCELGRKSGKTSLAAAIALYLLLADGEPGGEVYSAASDRDQAGLAFNVAVEMVRALPALSSRLRVVDSLKRIINPADGSFYRVIPADAPGSHGFNASGIILDEVHTQPNRDLVDALTTSVGARRQPVIVAITTAGYDRNSICWELHEYARQVRDGLIRDPTFLPVLYGADEQDDWTSPATWRKANPSLGHTVSEDFLADECARAQEIPAYQNTFRRLYLCQWTSQESRWLDIAAWDRGAGEVDADALAGQPCWIGLDLSSTTDITAMVAVFKDGDAYSVLCHFWMPAMGLRERARRDRAPYEQWSTAGLLETTPGNVIDYGAIERRISEYADRYQVREVAYDPWNASALVQRLVDGGLTCTPVRQGYASLSEPTKSLLELVLGDRLRHGGNPVLRWMSDNLTVTTDPAGNIKPDKSKSSRRIDGVVALIMALSRATAADTSDGVSVYEHKSLLVL